MSALRNSKGKDLYAVIAERLVKDPTFQTTLLQKPRLALRETLSQAGIKPTRDILNPLVSELNAFITENGDEMLVPKSEEYLGKVPELGVV